MQRAIEPAASRPEAQPCAIDPAALGGHLDRARQVRAELVAGLLRRGLGGMVRFIRPLVTTGPTR